MGEQVVEFGEEEGDGPEFLVAVFFLEMRRVTASELVVHYYWDFMRCPEVLNGEDVVVGDSWAAVETDEGSDIGGEGPEYGIPCFAGFACSGRVEVDFAFAEGNCHLEGS